jgi:hypothetical protein
MKTSSFLLRLAAATLAFLPGLVSARRATHVETDLGPTSFARQQIQTYRLFPRVPTTTP